MHIERWAAPLVALLGWQAGGPAWAHRSGTDFSALYHNEGPAAGELAGAEHLPATSDKRLEVEVWAFTLNLGKNTEVVPVVVPGLLDEAKNAGVEVVVFTFQEVWDFPEIRENGWKATSTTQHFYGGYSLWTLVMTKRRSISVARLRFNAPPDEREVFYADDGLGVSIGHQKPWGLTTKGSLVTVIRLKTQAGQTAELVIACSHLGEGQPVREADTQSDNFGSHTEDDGVCPAAGVVSREQHPLPFSSILQWASDQRR